MVNGVGAVLDPWIPIALFLLAAGSAALATRAFGRTRREGIGSGPLVHFSIAFPVSLVLGLLLLSGANRWGRLRNCPGLRKQLYPQWEVADAPLVPLVDVFPPQGPQ